MRGIDERRTKKEFIMSNTAYQEAGEMKRILISQPIKNPKKHGKSKLLTTIMSNENGLNSPIRSQG